MNKTIIENLSHSFKSWSGAIKAIEQFSLTINYGETVAILGPSGCGKSTILRCIAGLIEPAHGQIAVNDKPSKHALQEKMIGFSFQEAALLEWTTVMNNIKLPGQIGAPTVSSEQIDKKTIELINLVGLKGFEQFYPSQLSGGMKQRVALARALLLQPSLLLLDEPFGSLDLLTRHNLIFELNRILTTTGVPAIIVTHSIEEAVFLADRICILSPRPCEVIAEVTPDLGQKKDFDSPKFAAQVAVCRKILLERWSQDENK